jgi:molybdopterin synthase catalytic subunit
MNYLIEGPVTADLISFQIRRLSENINCGGHATFIGMVRADKNGINMVTAIEYSAYESMVKTEAEQIKAEILSHYEDVQSVEILHSNGTVKAGEMSLFVLVSAGHRKEAMEACAHTVELIKERLPVWKKEIYDDNSHVWQENK